MKIVLTFHKSGSPSGRVNIEGNPTHLPSGEKHRRVTPLKWHGTDMIASGNGSAIMTVLIIDENWYRGVRGC